MGGPSPSPSPQGQGSTAEVPAVAADQRSTVLGADWKKSGDMAWTTIGDATGFHVLVADAKSGYTWRTAATLSVPGLEADQWVGNACLTSSGRRAVVVYAPRSFTNKPELALRGGFTAVMDLKTGAVRKLPVTSSLAYFNPGCGSGETAVLTQEGDEDLGKTRLLRVGTGTGKMSKAVQVKGQITSAVPTASGITAAEGYRLVNITGDGRVRRVAATASVPSSLRVDREGAVAYLDRQSGTARLLRTRGKRTTVLAEGPAVQMGLSQGTSGRLYLTGRPSKVGRLPAGVARLNAPARAEISTHGAMALTAVTSRHDPFRKIRAAVPPPNPSGPQRVTISATVTGTGKTATFTVDPDARLSPKHQQGQASVRVYGNQAPASATRLRAAAGSPTDPRDTDGWCSISRNDVRAGVPAHAPAGGMGGGHGGARRQREPAGGVQGVPGSRRTRPRGCSPNATMSTFRRRSSWASWRRSPICGRPPAPPCPVSTATRWRATSTASNWTTRPVTSKTG